MARFVATSDWHIGARMGTAGRASRRFREEKFETVKRVLALARDEGATALFLLGDTFDGDGVGMEDIRKTVEFLAAAPCPVFVLPGNHDWWHAGGALSSFARAAEPHPAIRVLTEPGAPLSIDGAPGVVLYPCPVLKHADVADPTAWIPPREAGQGLRIGLIHGAFDRADWGGTVPERVADVRDLDLALLGDWHKPVDGPDGKTFYAGSLEPGGFDEEHQGGVILVAAADGAAAARRVPVGRLHYRRLSLDLESEEIGGPGPGALRSAVAGIVSDPGLTAVRLEISGRLTPVELDALDTLVEEQRAAGWAECEIRSSVEPLREPDLAGFEEDSVRAVAQRVLKADADPAVRRRALAILAEMVEETR